MRGSAVAQLVPHYTKAELGVEAIHKVTNCDYNNQIIRHVGAPSVSGHLRINC